MAILRMINRPAGSRRAMVVVDGTRLADLDEDGMCVAARRHSAGAAGIVNSLNPVCASDIKLSTPLPITGFVWPRRGGAACRGLLGESASPKLSRGCIRTSFQAA